MQPENFLLLGSSPSFHPGLRLFPSYGSSDLHMAWKVAMFLYIKLEEERRAKMGVFYMD